MCDYVLNLIWEFSSCLLAWALGFISVYAGFWVSQCWYECLLGADSILVFGSCMLVGGWLLCTCMILSLG